MSQWTEGVNFSQQSQSFTVKKLIVWLSLLLVSVIFLATVKSNAFTTKIFAMYCNEEFPRALVLQVLMKQKVLKEEFSISLCPVLNAYAREKSVV
jgi:hypothetical protein